MGGKYIVNQTAGKRYIILEEDEEKIEGGYFDTEGEWHELSGPLDGSLLGRYVINETDGKRIILLEENAEDIGGGYFEINGDWKSFGESVIVVSGERFMTTTGLGGNAPNYYNASNNTRLSYPYFDIRLEGGYKYRFIADVNVDTAQIGCSFYTQDVADKVENNANFTPSSECYDPGWLSLDTEIEVPAEVNNSPVIGVRITSRKDSNNTRFTDNFINQITIIKGERL